MPRITHRRPFSILTAALIGSALVGAATQPALAAGAFSALPGAWGGNGTIQPGNGTTERIRCNADYKPRGSSGNDVDINLRCASDSYNFDLTGQFTADGSNHISGQWTERTRNIVGNASGSARGDQIQVHVESGAFSADLSLTTRGHRQSVTIYSHCGGLPMMANISLCRR